MKPGAFQIAEGTITINEGREIREVTVKKHRITLHSSRFAFSFCGGQRGFII